MPLDPQAAALLADLPKDWYSDERYMLEQLRSRLSHAAAEQPCGCAAVDPTVQAWLLWETACPARSYSWGGPNGAPESNWGGPDMRSRPQLNRQEYNTTTKSGRAQASAAELENIALRGCRKVPLWEVEDRQMSMPNGNLAARIYRPLQADGVLQPAAVYFHGGSAARQRTAYMLL